MRRYIRHIRRIRRCAAFSGGNLRCNLPGAAAAPDAAVWRNARGLTVLFRVAFCLPFATIVVPASAQRSAEISCVQGHLFATVRLHDSLPVTAMLESGIPFPLIDSALVWAHPELFLPEQLDAPLRLRMASGARYVARYKLSAGLRVGDSRSLCESYVVDLGTRPEKLLYPLQSFTTDSLDVPGMFGLDLRRGKLLMLGSEELSAPDGAWRTYDMKRDCRTGMYCVEGALTLSGDDGAGACERMELIADLGNANLLALFTCKPRVGDFVVRSGIPRQTAQSRSGRRFEVLLPACVTFMDGFSFVELPVLLIERPVHLPGGGFLGVRFFERFRAVFDFRHERLWLAPLPE